MHMMNKIETFKLIQNYQPIEVFKAFITAFIFLLVLGAIVVIPVVQIAYIYIPFIEYLLLFVFLYISLIGIYIISIFIKTLVLYKEVNDVDIEKVKRQLTTSISIITFIAVLVIFIILN